MTNHLAAAKAAIHNDTQTATAHALIDIAETLRATRNHQPHRPPATGSPLASAAITALGKIIRDATNNTNTHSAKRTNELPIEPNDD